MPRPHEVDAAREGNHNPHWLAFWQIVSEIVSEEVRRLDAREAERAATEAEKR